MKVFVTNFEYSTTLADLAVLFEKFGHLEAIRMKQGEKRRYALIEMDADGGERAIAELDRKQWQGTRLEVTESRW